MDGSDDVSIFRPGSLSLVSFSIFLDIISDISKVVQPYSLYIECIIFLPVRLGQSVLRLTIVIVALNPLFECQLCFRILRAIIVVGRNPRIQLDKLVRCILSFQRLGVDDMANSGRPRREQIQSILLPVQQDTERCCQSSGAVTRHDIGININLLIPAVSKTPLLTADGLHILMLV